jgi:hypothetical protein
MLFKVASDLDAFLFIDANAYLTLYRTITGKKLLKPLLEQREHIFLTRQVVEEVQRNKLKVAAQFLTEKFGEIQLAALNVPDHLLNALEPNATQLRQRHKEIREKLDELNAHLTTATDQILRLISQSQDEVSKSLVDLFAAAVPHTQEELGRARDRRERGTPPGKKGDPLGDQLTWEQLLTHSKQKAKVWIITNDSDYCTGRSGRAFLNPLLFQDLVQFRSPAPDVFCFGSIDDGLVDFVKATGVKAEARLTQEESKEIKKELESLPPLGWLKSASSDASEALIEHWHQQRFATWLAATTKVANPNL